MLTATMPLRAAKHIACSCSAAVVSACVPSPAKLSPATNNSTARGEPSSASGAATSRTFRSLSPYFSLRENSTCSHDFALSALASAGEAPPACDEAPPACGEALPACGEALPACGEALPGCVTAPTVDGAPPGAGDSVSMPRTDEAP